MCHSRMGVGVCMGVLPIIKVLLNLSLQQLLLIYFSVHSLI